MKRYNYHGQPMGPRDLLLYLGQEVPVRRYHPAPPWRDLCRELVGLEGDLTAMDCDRLHDAAVKQGYGLSILCGPGGGPQTWETLTELLADLAKGGDA